MDKNSTVTKPKSLVRECREFFLGTVHGRCALAAIMSISTVTVGYNVFYDDEGNAQYVDSSAVTPSDELETEGFEAVSSGGFEEEVPPAQPGMHHD